MRNGLRGLPGGSTLHADPEPREVIPVEPTLLFTVRKVGIFPSTRTGRVYNTAKTKYYQYFKREMLITVNAWHQADAIQAVNRWFDEFLEELWPTVSKPWRQRSDVTYEEIPNPFKDEPQYVELTRKYLTKTIK